MSLEIEGQLETDTPTFALVTAKSKRAGGEL